MLKLKVSVWLSVALSMMLLASGIAGTVEKETEDAELEEIDDSGITADILFVDTGTELSIVGVATGLDPALAYFSLIYDVESPDDGPLACEPGIFDPTDPDFLDDPQMVVGFWHPMTGSSTRTLSAVKSAGGNTNFGLVGPLAFFATAPSYAAVDAIGTISVRVVLGPPPAGFVLQACGDL